MGHVFDPKQMAKLDNPRRKELMPPEKILEILGVRTGSWVADVGCGIGYLAIPAAQRVGTMGHVFALDLQEQMLVEGCRRSEAEKLANIAWILNPEDTVPLPAESLDVALMAVVFHEVKQAAKLLKEIRRILVLGGKVGIVEWTPGFTQMGPPDDQRLSPSEVANSLKLAGFNRVRHEDLSPAFYMALGEKS